MQNKPFISTKSVWINKMWVKQPGIFLPFFVGFSQFEQKKQNKTKTKTTKNKTKTNIKKKKKKKWLPIDPTWSNCLPVVQDFLFFLPLKGNLSFFLTLKYCWTIALHYVEKLHKL